MSSGTSIFFSLGCLPAGRTLAARRVRRHEKSARAADRDGIPVDGELAGQEKSPPVYRGVGSDQANRDACLQGFFRFLAHKGSNVSIHEALRTSHHQMHAGGAARGMFQYNFLDRAFKSSLVRRIIDRTKTPSGAGYRRRVGIE